MSKVIESGYRSCACRDCMEIAIGEPGAMCHECEDAGCPGDRDCQASEAYGGEAEEPREGLASEPLTAALIRARCEHAGFCLVSDGSVEPAVIIERLLVTLGALDPEALDAFIHPEAALLAVPNEAAADPAHAFWDSAEAQALLEGLYAALNRAAPAGFIFACEGEALRLGFFRC
jgi:hypothetical protein